MGKLVGVTRGAFWFWFFCKREGDPKTHARLGVTRLPHYCYFAAYEPPPQGPTAHAAFPRALAPPPNNS